MGSEHILTFNGPFEDVVSSTLKHTLQCKGNFWGDIDTNILRLCVHLLLTV